MSAERANAIAGRDGRDRAKRDSLAMTAPDPELDAAAAAMVGEGARFVVIGGFAVIANRFGQAHLRATTDAGIVDVMRDGLPPLDYDTVAAAAMSADYGSVEFLVASLIPQTPSGMGPRTQRDRILGSVETLIVHAVNEPEEIAALAGTRKAVELTHRYREGIREREGFARAEERPKVHPDRVRELATGTAWVIRRGRATKVAVARAPSAQRAALPKAQPLDRPHEQVEVSGPKEIAYLDEEG
jgi:hypothetical protein